MRLLIAVLIALFIWGAVDAVKTTLEDGDAFTYSTRHLSDINEDI